MTKYPFEHDGPVFVLHTETHNIFYYARDGKKFKRTRRANEEDWKFTTEQEIDNDTFWMVVACIERKR